MKILFAGTPEIALPSLMEIYSNNSIQICGVLTCLDKESGRGKKVISSPVKKWAIEKGLTVIQADKMNDELIAIVRSLEPEMLVVVAFGIIFPRRFLDIFPGGGVNLHPSLLPKHRGPSPISATILSGDREAGVTIQYLGLKMDSGDILAQEKVLLNGDETTEILTKEFGLIGSRLLIDVLNRIQAKTIVPVSQDETKASYCRLLSKQEGWINWDESAVVIERKIRAYNPWPMARTLYQGKILNFYKASVYNYEKKEDSFEKGCVIGVDKEYGILVHTGEGIIAIQKLQIQSKNPMDFKAFLNGNKGIIGSCLGK